MAKIRKRKRQYFCVGGWTSKRDAEIDAKIFREHGGHKATVKSDGSGWKVCYTMGTKRRHQVPKHLRAPTRRRRRRSR